MSVLDFCLSQQSIEQSCFLPMGKNNQKIVPESSCQNWLNRHKRALQPRVQSKALQRKKIKIHGRSQIILSQFSQSRTPPVEREADKI